MQVWVGLTVSPMRVDHRDGATLERLASDLAIEIVQALHPAGINALNKTAALWEKVVRNIAGTVRMMWR
jgi:hypothetical protein